MTASSIALFREAAERWTSAAARQPHTTLKAPTKIDESQAAGGRLEGLVGRGFDAYTPLMPLADLPHIFRQWLQTGSLHLYHLNAVPAIFDSVILSWRILTLS